MVGFSCICLESKDVPLAEHCRDVTRTRGGEVRSDQEREIARREVDGTGAGAVAATNAAAAAAAGDLPLLVGEVAMLTQ